MTICINVFPVDNFPFVVFSMRQTWKRKHWKVCGYESKHT